MKNTSILCFVLLSFAACQDDEPMRGEIGETDEECLTRTSVRNGSVVPDQYIVTFSTNDNSGKRVGDFAARISSKYSLPANRILSIFDGDQLGLLMRLDSNEVERVRADDNVELVEPDRILSICSCFEIVAPRTLRWNVQKVGYGDGTGKTAWVLDTGIDLDHPDLRVDQSRSRSFLQGQTSANDENGHGTHVAGVIGALNNTSGVVGVASGATLVALKVLDREGEGYVSTVLSGLNHVRRLGRPGDVINLSLGVDQISQSLDRELHSLASQGFFIAIAAGNERKRANEFSPARINGENIYTVSAVDSLNRFASFSNFGNDVVDFAAPGVGIPSTYVGGRYALMSGTSMAAPHVAGLLLINNGKINSLGVALNDPDGTPDRIAHQ